MAKCPVIKQGKILPVLENPAKNNNVETGYQAIDSNGNVINGTGKMLNLFKKAITTSDIHLQSENYTGFPINAQNLFIKSLDGDYVDRGLQAYIHIPSFNITLEYSNSFANRNDVPYGFNFSNGILTLYIQSGHIYAFQPKSRYEVIVW